MTTAPVNQSPALVYTPPIREPRVDPIILPLDTSNNAAPIPHPVEHIMADALLPVQNINHTRNAMIIVIGLIIGLTSSLAMMVYGGPVVVLIGQVTGGTSALVSAILVLINYLTEKKDQELIQYAENNNLTLTPETLPQIKAQLEASKAAAQ